MINYPKIIQGGMGIAVSNWTLARAVSATGQLGVVSGTAINSVMVRRLQDGDHDGTMRLALAAFPNQDIAKDILANFFIEGGKEKDKPYKRAQMYSLDSAKSLLQLTVAASFAEVWLAKQGHKNAVGINLLEKIHLPNLACLYGAILADVEYVIMGAGIPREIPGALDLLSQNLTASLKIPVEGSSEEHLSKFNPEFVMDGKIATNLKRPLFLPIVSSATLALNLKRKSTGAVNGFIVEGPLAGGHNAPPRGPMKLNDRGEPIYGPRDEVCLGEMAALELPFWMAGDYATPEKLADVCSKGAQGIQVGTLFAFSKESGVSSQLRESTLKTIAQKQAPEGGWVFTDPRSSPTGFPFKAVRLEDSISNSEMYLQRKRICDLGYLRHAYKKEDGSVGQRCPAEPVQDYLKKGGLEEDTIGRKCLCNALFADIGMPQIQSAGKTEQHLLTAGDDLNKVDRLFKSKNDFNYSAADVIAYLEGHDAPKLSSPEVEKVFSLRDADL